MTISKAVITAAGPNQQHLLLQTLIDREGRNRKVLGLLLDEITSAGIENVALVVRPGHEALYKDAMDSAQAKLTFIVQPEPRGYGHAVLCAREFTGDSPFLLMMSDHVYVSDRLGKTCAQQLVQVASTQEQMVSAVQATHESKLAYFGAVSATVHESRERLYRVSRVTEKPSPTEAEQHLMTPGLRNGYYLCFAGMHVLTPLIMELLQERFETLSPEGKLDLSASLNEAARRTRYLACAIQGRRYDLDHRHGVLMAQLAVALDGHYRDELLAGLVELLALTPAKTGVDGSSNL
jgi:UTP--glucose-1-phosphate uridylyltransferase